MIGSSFSRFAAENDRERLQKLLTIGQSDHVETNLSLKTIDGTSIPVRLSLTPLRLVGFTGLGAIFTDLSLSQASGGGR